jgi:hypothetical protein
MVIVEQGMCQRVRGFSIGKSRESSDTAAEKNGLCSNIEHDGIVSESI